MIICIILFGPTFCFSMYYLHHFWDVLIIYFCFFCFFFVDFVLFLFFLFYFVFVCFCFCLFVCVINIFVVCLFLYFIFRVYVCLLLFCVELLSGVFLLSFQFIVGRFAKQHKYSCTLLFLHFRYVHVCNYALYCSCTYTQTNTQPKAHIYILQNIPRIISRVSQVPIESIFCAETLNKWTSEERNHLKKYNAIIVGKLVKKQKGLWHFKRKNRALKSKIKHNRWKFGHRNGQSKHSIYRREKHVSKYVQYHGQQVSNSDHFITKVIFRLFKKYKPVYRAVYQYFKKHFDSSSEADNLKWDNDWNRCIAWAIMTVKYGLSWRSVRQVGEKVSDEFIDCIE